MFEGRTADADREAIILKSFVGHDTDLWWNTCHEDILDAVFGERSYSSHIDTGVPTIARCLKKLLSGTLSPETCRAVALTFATHGSTTMSEACWKTLKGLPGSTRS